MGGLLLGKSGEYFNDQTNMKISESLDFCENLRIMFTKINPHSSKAFVNIVCICIFFSLLLTAIFEKKCNHCKIISIDLTNAWISNNYLHSYFYHNYSSKVQQIQLLIFRKVALVLSVTLIKSVS